MPGYTITTAAPTAAPVEIGYVTFASPDTAAAAAFYGELFGWHTQPGPSGAEYAHIGNTKLPIGLSPGAAEEGPVVYFRVDDLGSYTARVRELGGQVVSETAYDSGPNAVCRDPQGRQFQLWQPAPGYE
jgi:predicted enzyme related to lactoylglutathione lyase